MKLLSAVFLVVTASLAVQAQTFKFVAIDVPNSTQTTANGINYSGTIVGSYTTTSGHTHGYRLQSGKFTTIDYPSSTSTVINGINDYGDVVGTYQLSGSQKTHGFIRFHTGSLRKLDFPNATFGTTANGINKSLEVVGSFNNGNQFGYTYKNGTYTKVSAPTNSFPDTILNGISNPGVIVGQVFSGDSWRGFWKLGSDLDFLEPFLNPDNIVYGVNGHTDLVGCHNGGRGFWIKLAESSEAEGSSEKFPSISSIQYTNHLNTCPMSINYNRSIVGTYLDNSTFLPHGFLAIPQ